MITIFGCQVNEEMDFETSIVEEFFDQLKLSEAKNGCIMLPGNMQYWRPSEERGAKEINIDEPIHFAGPSPKTPINQATTNIETQQIEEEKKEPATNANEDDERGPARQVPDQQQQTGPKAMIRKNLEEWI